MARLQRNSFGTLSFFSSKSLIHPHFGVPPFYLFFLALSFFFWFIHLRENLSFFPYFLLNCMFNAKSNLKP